MNTKRLQHLSRFGWLRRFQLHRFLDRWGYFLLLSTCLGCLAGCLLFFFAPIKNEAAAELFIVTRSSPSQSLETEMELIGSQSSIYQTIREQNLMQLRFFQDQKEEEIAQWIAERLRVETVSSDIVRVSIPSDSKEASSRIVAGLVKCYRERIRGFLAAQANSPAQVESQMPQTLSTTDHASRTTWTRRVTQNALVGLLVALTLAILFDFVDSRYRDPNEISEHVKLPVVQHVPGFEKIHRRSEIDASLVAVQHARGRANEAYQTLRVWLAHCEGFSNGQILQVASPLPGDGKSTLAANLAVNVARSGRRVLLVDADMRRPRISHLFKLSADIGLVTLLVGYSDLAESIQSTFIEGLSVLPAGRRPSNPSELLSSRPFKDLLQQVRRDYDLVVIDTPNLLSCSDALAVAGLADGVLMTIRLQRQTKPTLDRACQLLDSIHANTLGIVVNGNTPGYSQAYSYWEPSFRPTDSQRSEHYVDSSVDGGAENVFDIQPPSASAM